MGLVFRVLPAVRETNQEYWYRNRRHERDLVVPATKAPIDLLTQDIDLSQSCPGLRGSIAFYGILKIVRPLTVAKVQKHYSANAHPVIPDPLRPWPGYARLLTGGSIR